MHRTTRRTVLAATATVLCVAALAAACGSGGSGGSGGEQAGTTTTNPAITIAPKGSPKAGGKIVYGLEAETDGWDPSKNRWAISALEVANAIFDPLMAFDAEGKAQPYLLETSTHNADYTVWTGKLRAGVTFHDGTPVNADALITFTNAIKNSTLTGPAAANIDRVEKVDDLTVNTIMKRPWVAFPNLLTAQGGMLAAPSMLADPQGNNNPVGSGPFVFKQWDKGARLVVAKNQSYWRAGLPYLDSVEFQPISEAQTRLKALQSGSANIVHLNTMAQIKELESDASSGSFQMITDTGPQEKTTVMLNLRKAPLDDVRVRKALVLATDAEQVAELNEDDPAKIVKGPISPDSPFYTGDTAYPGYDLQQAKDLIAQYVQEKGPVKLSLATIPSTESQRTTQAVADMWKQAGVDVTIPANVDQLTFIGQVVSGQFDAVLWRQYGEADPDSQYHWWTSANANPTGQFSLNFPGIKDAQIDADLAKGRENADQGVRVQAYQDLQKRMAELLPYVWLIENTWVIGADTTVRDITNGPLPDGQPSQPLVNGWHRLTQTWIER